MFRSSINMPRQTPMIPCPAIAANATRDTASTSHATRSPIVCCTATPTMSTTKSASPTVCHQYHREAGSPVCVASCPAAGFCASCGSVIMALPVLLYTVVSIPYFPPASLRSGRNPRVGVKVWCPADRTALHGPAPAYAPRCDKAPTRQEAGVPSSNRTVASSGDTIWRAQGRASGEWPPAGTGTTACSVRTSPGQRENEHLKQRWGRNAAQTPASRFSKYGRRVAGRRPGYGRRRWPTGRRP